MAGTIFGPQPVPDTTVQRPARLTVHLGDADGNAPTSDDQVSWLIPLEIFRGSGGRTEDYAVFAYDLGRREEHIHDVQAILGFNRLVEIRMVTSEEDEAWAPIFWGEILSQSIRIDVGETLTVTARMVEYLYGEILKGEQQFDPVTETRVTRSGDVVFNPYINGIVESNQSSKKDATEAFNLWVDVEAVRTSTARTYQGGITSLLWGWVDAFKALFGITNRDEQQIKNPDVDADGLFDDAPELYNLRLRRGRYLPSYLDAMLRPIGFDWFVNLSRSDDATLKQIVIYKRGEGTEKELHLQPIGEELDLAETNTAGLTADTDIGDLINALTCYGSREEVEVTVELYRGWAEAEDSKTTDDLRRSDEFSDYEDFQNAWRLWVGNEGGDYCSLRTSTQPIPSTARDLSSVFAEPLEINGSVKIMPGRRPVMDCLTYDENRRRRPPLVEYSIDGGTTWIAAPIEWGFQTLKDQIGVYFTGDIPPGELIKAGNDARLRITGTIQSDSHIAKKAVTTVSPNNREVAAIYEFPDKFHLRRMTTSGTYASVLKDDENGADTVDDRSELADHATNLLDKEQSAALRCEIQIPGIEVGYGPGDLITKVSGREISLNRNHPNTNSKAYAQVTGVRWDPQRQITTLSVEAIEDQA